MNLEQSLSAALDRYLHQADGRTPPHLEESIRYSLLGPGKRVRARLILSTAKMLGLSEDQAMPIALAMEMIHCFTLIHDDLPCMDDDDFRRGRPSNHKKFDEPTALLAGDALMALALDVFMDSAIPTQFLHRGLKRLVWAMGPRGVIGGQAAESLLSERSKISELYQMHAQKTGALFSASVLIPKDLVGITDESHQGHSLAAFASELGLAFQIADDLEDAEKDPRSILFYLSSQEACARATSQLQVTSEALTEIWGEKAQELCHISEEVIQKAQLALEKLN